MILGQARQCGLNSFAGQHPAKIPKAPFLEVGAGALQLQVSARHRSAYKPFYTNEGKPRLPNDKLIAEIFVPRFANNESKADYPFYTADDEGMNHLNVFRKLMKKVTEKYVALLKSA